MPDENGNPTMEDLMAQIREQNAAISNLAQTQSGILQKLNTPASKPEEEIQAPTFDRDTFFAKPDESVGAVVDHRLGVRLGKFQKDIVAMLEPLVKNAAVTSVTTEYNRLKAQMKTTAEYADLGDFEGIFDEIMSSANDIKPGTMIAAYHIAESKFRRGGGSKKTTTTETTTTENGRKPPFFEANKPKIDPSTGLVALRPLNELEKKLMRENEMSHHKVLLMNDEIDETTYNAYEAKAKAAAGGK